MRLLFGLDRRPLFSHGKDQRMGLGKGRRKFCNGVVIAAITAESRPITQTFQRADSIRRSLSAHRLRALHNHRTHLRPVQPVNQRKQLRVVQPQPGRRNLRPAELRLLERLGKAGYRSQAT